MRIVTARAFHLALAKRHVREAKLLTRALRMALRTGSEDSRFAQADAVDWPVHYRVAIGAGNITTFMRAAPPRYPGRLFVALQTKIVAFGEWSL